jgi:hypothetical protein
MGYQIHIARSDEGWTNDDLIRLAEFEAVVENEPDLQQEDILRLLPTGIVFSGPGLARWTPDPAQPEEWIIFQLQQGMISFRGNVAMEHIERLRELARKLNAVIIGDEGELY